ncbi:unnamed protein product [Rotaria sp. Silwood1]|nr:unnamed protein product [Rotaria sp. Silwood1]
MSTDLNIVLLGQTGVGKTTFINSFANYLVHNSLDDGIKGELQAPIPASFFYMDKDTFEDKEINIGTPHESEQTTVVGESCTRECRSFLFRINNRDLRLIDTPGIGDTQGVLQDEKNFANILAFISQYEHLNGICVLLKPNEDRLTILFRFCLKELLRHLHVQARENIMFVFTNARSTSFQPARAAPMLRTLLESLKNVSNAVVPFSRENTFCLDNEGFRFLALCKNGIHVSSEDTQDYSRSWKHTMEEFQRLLSRIAQCDKHVTRDTVSLNEAQQLIRKLSRPIAEITTLIQTNIQLAEKHKNNVSSNETLTPQVLEQIDIQIIELGYPRTVCTNRKCIKVIMADGLEKIDYVTHCHAHCYLSGVEEELIGDEKIKSCAIIKKSSG